MNAAAGILVAVVRVTERDTGRPLTVAWHRLMANDQRLTVELRGAEYTRKCLLPHRPYVFDVHYESALRRRLPQGLVRGERPEQVRRAGGFDTRGPGAPPPLSGAASRPLRGPALK